jgi:hypothetical protein
MTWRRRKSPVAMIERLRQVARDREVVLDPFTQAELDAVTIDPGWLPYSARGPAPQEVAPLLAALEADRSGSGGPGGPSPAAQPAHAPEGDALAAAAARLEHLGYIRPGEPAQSDDPFPSELAGWSADPAGGGVRRVAIRGDLGLITRVRSQPYCVAEGSASAEPALAGQPAARWQLVARLYGAWTPAVGLLERPAGADGRLPPLTLVTPEYAYLIPMGWVGVDPQEFAGAGQGRSEAERRAAAATWSPAVPTGDVAGEFTSVGRVSVAHPDGEQVLVRRLIVASGGGRRWMLESDRADRGGRAYRSGAADRDDRADGAERCVQVSVDQIGERLEAMFSAPGQAT